MDWCAKSCVIILVLFILFMAVSLPLVLDSTGESYKIPEFSVEQGTIVAYNLTSDNHLFCIINLAIRAYNPNKKHSLHYSSMYVSLKRAHRVLADDRVHGFSQGRLEQTVFDAEAVGLFAPVKKSVARDLRSEREAGAIKVDVKVQGALGSSYLTVVCKGMMLEVSTGTSNGRTKCGVFVHYQNQGY